MKKDVQIAIRLPQELLAQIDRLVATKAALSVSRSAMVRALIVESLRAHLRELK